MKKFLLFSFLTTLLFSSLTTTAQQDKSKRPSPPATVSATLANGNTVTIDYSQPSLKGRTIGKELAEFGKVWRTGANEATTFEITKDAQIEGKSLPAGKYSLYSIPGDDSWTIIFNKNWKQWGTVYDEAADQLRITAKPTKTSSATEKMTFSINKSGLVTLLWGNTSVGFTVK